MVAELPPELLLETEVVRLPLLEAEVGQADPLAVTGTPLAVTVTPLAVIVCVLVLVVVEVLVLVSVVV